MIAQAFKEVFARARYIILAAGVALAVFVLATWLPNLGLVWQITSSTAIPLADKARILAALIGSIGTNFTIFSALSTALIALLFGANVAMISYYLCQYLPLGRQAGQTGIVASLGGLTAGLFGVGCAACGTLVLGPLLAFTSAGSFLALLPLGGEELSVAGIALLSFSLVLTARRISTPLACSVPRPSAIGTMASRIFGRETSRQ